MKTGIDWTEKYYTNHVGINPENITFLIVLSSRTVKWLEGEDMDVMEPQYAPVNSSYLEVFDDTKYFGQIADFSQEIYVFRMN
jgi:hypothetical protein